MHGPRKMYSPCKTSRPHPIRSAFNAASDFPVPSPHPIQCGSSQLRMSMYASPVLSVLVLFGSWLSAPFRLSYPLLVLIQCRTFLSHDHIPHPFKVCCSVTVLFAKVTELPTFGSNKQSLSGTFNRLALPLIRAPLHALILRTSYLIKSNVQRLFTPSELLGGGVFGLAVRLLPRLLSYLIVLPRCSLLLSYLAARLSASFFTPPELLNGMVV